MNVIELDIFFYFYSPKTIVWGIKTGRKHVTEGIPLGKIDSKCKDPGRLGSERIKDPSLPLNGPLIYLGCL